MPDPSKLSLIEFALYVLPGFLALEVYRSRFPARDRSPFAHAAECVLYGVIITVLLASFGLIGSSQGKLPAFDELVWLVLGGVACGVMLVWFHDTRVSLINSLPCNPPLRRLLALMHRTPSLWNELNQPHDNWCMVYLEDGSIYRGWIRLFDGDANRENHDFLLSSASLLDSNLNELYRIEGLGLFANTANVRRIEYVRQYTRIEADRNRQD